MPTRQESADPGHALVAGFLPLYYEKLYFYNFYSEIDTLSVALG